MLRTPQISKAGRRPWARVLVPSAEEGEGPGREEGPRRAILEPV